MARHLVIRGRVQGVGYRESMRSVAGRLGITGWVRNRMDGSVEALIEGTPEALEAMLAWARHGPPVAHVDEFLVDECPDEGLAEFQRRPTR